MPKPHQTLFALGLVLGLIAVNLAGWSVSARSSHDVVSTIPTHKVARSSVSGLVAAPPTFATLNVTKTADTNDGACDADCSLREAIAVAAAGDTITFLPAVTGTITLTGGELLINKGITIQGPGAQSLTISGNDASRAFLLLNAVGTVSISGLTITNGKGDVGGGIRCEASAMQMDACVVTDNNAVTGAGIFVFAGTANITNSTISGNSSTSVSGGIRIEDSTATLVNCTVSGNLAPIGTEVAVLQFNTPTTVTLANCTVANQHNSNAVYLQDAPLRLQNTLVSALTQNFFNNGGTITSLGNNIDTDGTSGLVNGVSGDKVGSSGAKINALLAPLGNYGGPTQTHALLPGSPAINGGAGGAATDQRGIARPQQSISDIGAFESRGFTLAIAGGNNQSTSANAAFASPLSVTVTPIAAGEPVDGSKVTFTVPASGASATIAGNPAAIAGGTAASGVVTANANVGTYQVVASAAGVTSTVNFTLTNINVPPTIIAGAALTRQQGSPATNSPIATVFDANQAAGTLSFTAMSVPGITVTNIVNTEGAITANVEASCTATLGANTVVLQVTDSSNGAATTNLTVNVTANTPPSLSYNTSNFAVGTTPLISPATGPTDNGTISSIALQSVTPNNGLALSVNNTTGQVQVTSATLPGSYSANILATDNCAATTTATLNVTVVGPPSITKAFGASSIQQNGTTSLTFTITNPNPAEALTGLSFTDTFPLGMVVASPLVMTNTCVGMLTDDTNGALAAGDAGIKLSGGTVASTAPGTCTVSVNVTATSAGQLNNVSGNVSSTNGGTGNNAQASITVNAPPTIATVATTRQQGSPLANSTIANVSDAEDAENTLSVKVNGGVSATVNGVTVSNIAVSAAGVVTADVVASCTATNASFTLRVTDSQAGFAEATLNVTVTANTAPVLGTYAAMAIAPGASFSVPASAGPTDNGTIASVTAAVAPAAFTGTVSVNSASGLLTISNAGPAGNYIVTVTATDNCGAKSTATLALAVQTLTGSISDPFECTGRGDAMTVTLIVGNVSAVPQNASATATVGAGLLALPGTCTASAGTCTVVNPTSVAWTGTLAPGQNATINYQVQVADNVQPGATLCIQSTATFGGGPPASVNFCTSVNCPPVGPGEPLVSNSETSAARAGSMLIYNLYTSSASMPAQHNSRISITNTDPSRSVSLHLFFIDGETCSVADRFTCLTPQQTASFLASDFDPGVSGYLVVVAVDSVTGCPISFNQLIGDVYVKSSAGFAASLAAESVPAIAGGLPLCDTNSVTATLQLDGVSYGRIGRVLAVSSLQAQGDGNETLLVLNRIGGNFMSSAVPVGKVFGIVFDDAERAHSFNLESSACQLRGILGNSFPRTVPRYNEVIPSGRTGWMKMWTTVDGGGLTGAAINYNAQAGTNPGAFNQGRNLHKLTLTSQVSLTIPIFPPTC